MSQPLHLGVQKDAHPHRATALYDRGVRHLLALITCAGHLVLLVLVMARGGRSPLTLPLGALALDLFLFNAATLAFRLTGREAWHALDDAASPFAMALTFHVVAVFVGKARRLRPVLALFYAFFTAFAAWTVWRFARDGAMPFGWSYTFLVCELVIMPWTALLLVQHLRTTTDEKELLRARMILTALLVSIAFGMTEFVDTLGFVGMPRLADVGTLVSATLLVTVTLRLELLGRELPTSALAWAVLLGGLGALGYVAALRWLAAGTALVTVVAGVVTLALLSGTRDVFGALARERSRAQELATLGRFSAQMSHDLKNPLAALHGAVQFLEEERRAGRSIDGQGEFLTLMHQQIERIARVLERYGRLSRVEPVKEPIDPNALVERALGLQTFALPAGITLERELTPGIGACRLDADLVVVALVNVLQNAAEAVGARGRIHVSTSALAGGPGVEIAVIDDGPGMDPRTRARALEDFFTTKAQGSGLGLPYVARIVEAHGGALLLGDGPGGRGTRVCMRLPDRST